MSISLSGFLLRILIFFILYRLAKFFYRAIKTPLPEIWTQEEPSDFKFEIEDYQQLRNSTAMTGSSRIESIEFNAGGHSWVLVVYLNRNRRNNDGRDVSLFLRLAKLPDGGAPVFASYKFFFYDTVRGGYLFLNENRERCFDTAHRECGYDQPFLVTNYARSIFRNNSLTIGAEVYVRNSTGRNATAVARLSLIRTETLRTYTWSVYNYSTLRADTYSDSFLVEGRSWKLRLYPRGNMAGQGQYISLYLYLEDLDDLIGGRKLYVECTLSIRDQINGTDHKHTAGFWFDVNNDHHGLHEFLSLAELNNPLKGYKEGDTLLIDANLDKMFRLQRV